MSSVRCQVGLGMLNSTADVFTASASFQTRFGARGLRRGVEIMEMQGEELPGAGEGASRTRVRSRLGWKRNSKSLGLRT